MTHQVPEYYRAVSECLSNILDNVGYSREDRDRKVRVATETEVFNNMAMSLEKLRLRMYMFGSRGEGSTGPGLQSDTDILYQNDAIKVVTDVTDCQKDKFNFLMVKDDFTHPGYVKLQQIILSPDSPPIPIYHVENINKAVTLDILNRSVMLNTFHDHFGPGSVPEVHYHLNHNYSGDSVFALRCSQWPREGYEWFQRRRFYGWPTPKQIENAWGYGCFVTLVGHPHSSEQHLEWRLSFSIAERDLTRSLEDTAMKVYTLLKIINKTFIKPVLQDAFSSYHCKSCMLWMRERTPHELWSDQNLLYCLNLCIRQLYEWATTGFCPDYFIVMNNIYDRKIVGTKQFHLVQTLGYLLSADCSFLLGMKCCNLGQLLKNKISGLGIHHISNIPLISEEVNFDYKLSIKNACHCRYAILEHVPQYYPTLVDYLERIIRASKHSPYIMQYPLKYVMVVLWSQLGFILPQSAERRHVFCLVSN